MNRMSGRTGKIARRNRWLPPWNMPSDPVKAVWWFLHWLLKVLVRYFWIAILGMIIYETYINWRVSSPFNGIVAGVITLFVGLIVWGAIYLVLLAVNVSTTVSQTIENIGQMQHTYTPRTTRRPGHPFTTSNPFGSSEVPEENVVEGTITDLEEERRKRRRE